MCLQSLLNAVYFLSHFLPSFLLFFLVDDDLLLDVSHALDEGIYVGYILILVDVLPNVLFWPALILAVGALVVASPRSSPHQATSVLLTLVKVRLAVGLVNLNIQSLLLSCTPLWSGKIDRHLVWG